MKRWTLILPLLLSLGLNVGVFGTLIANRMQAGRESAASGQGAPELEGIADRLELAGGERSRFIESQREFVVEIRRRARDLAGERRLLREALTAAEPDRARVQALVSSTGARAQELDSLFADNVLRVREILDGPGEARYLRFLAQLYTRERSGAPGGLRRRGRGR